MTEPRTRYEEFEAQWEEFNRDHPEVWREFQRIALELMRRGYARYSAAGIIHIIRWETRAGGRPGEGFKVNNNLRSVFVRRFDAKYPQHASFFVKRRLLSKDAAAKDEDPVELHERVTQWDYDDDESQGDLF